MAEILRPNRSEPPSVFKSDARIKSEDEHNKNRELCNSEEKLCNFGVAASDASHAEP